MTVAQVNSLESAAPFDYGLNLYYNAERLTVAYFSKNETVLDLYSVYYDGMNITLFCEAMFLHIQTYLMHGSVVSLNN